MSCLTGLTPPRQSRARILKKGVAVMQADIHRGKAVLALFDGGENVSRDVPALTAGLYLAHKSAGDEIYTAAP